MAKLFPFVQLEFTHSLGPDAGSYVVPSSADGDGSDAGADPAPDELSTTLASQAGTADVLAIHVVGASKARSGGLIFRRGPSELSRREQPSEVPLSLATLIKATLMVDGKRDAQSLIKRIADDEAERDAWVEDAVATLNYAIRAYRLVAADPYVIEVSRLDAREIRLGYGTGDDVVNGRWASAFGLPPPETPRLARGERLRPSEGVAAIVGGRVGMLDAEDLALRALLDLEVGATRRAALETRSALEMLVAELGDAPMPKEASRDYTALTREAGPFAERVPSVLNGDLDEPELAQELRSICERVLATAGRWRSSQLD